MITLPENGLYAVTDDKQLDTDVLVKKTDDILNAGAAILQYRNKTTNHGLKITQAKLLQGLCIDYSVPFIINDDVELARTLNADGVHLGHDDTDCKKARIILGPDKIIGVSCYNELDCGVTMQMCGASYVAFGAFFPTQTKANTAKAEPELIFTAKQKLNIPVVAIGGITPENGKILIDAGADFLAVISGLYNSEDPVKATRAYVKLFN